jgi:stage V sporulation protein B
MEKGRTKGTTVVGGALSLTIATLTVKILGVIYKIPLASILGEEGMGYFNSAYTVYAFFYLLCTAGVPKAVMMLVTESEAEGRGRSYAVARAATGAFAVIGAVITLSFVLMSAPLSRLIGNSASRATMLAVAPSIIFVSISGVVRGVLNARMRLTEIAVSQILEGVGKLVFGLALAVLASRLSLPLYLCSALTIIGVSLGAIIGLIYLLAVLKPYKSSNKPRQKIRFSERKSLLKRILSISLPITAGAAVMSLSNLIDLSLIMRRLESLGYSEAEAGALYGNYTTLAVPIFNLVISIITPVSIAFMPIFARARVSADKGLRDAALRDSLELSAIITAPLLFGTLAFSEQILSILFSNMNISLGAPLLCLLIPAVFFVSPLLIINSALEAQGHLRAPLISMLVGAMTKLVTSYLLLGRADFGISGAPIGTVVSYAAALCTSLFVAFSCTDLRPPLLFTQIASYPASLVSVAVAKLLFDKLACRLGVTAAFALAVLICAALYFLCLLLLGKLTPERIRKMSKYTKPA